MIADRPFESENRNARVLIADDEEQVRIVLITFLNKLGYRTVAVENGQLALEEIQEGDVDLVISDYSMPILTGIEFYNRMVRSREDLADKFILITGTAFTDEVTDFLEAHHTPFLEKPFRLSDLENAIVEALSVEEPKRLAAT